jgi:hypothetical protein
VRAANTPARGTPVPAGTRTHPVRDLGAVAPELRARVGRVIDRMRREFGHTVEVVESSRSQERQDFLFAQGRTRPGPVVTWTRHSEHTLGRAVDVTIDGGYDDTAAFRLLQRVAREEGLATLGMRDPGHLQLPSEVAGEVLAAGAPWGEGVRVESLGVETGHAPADPLTPPRALAPSAGAGVAAVAEVAPVAPVAPVAAVAQVASVAQVAPMAAVAAPGAPGAAPAMGTAPATPAAATPAPAPSRRAGPPAHPAAPADRAADAGGAPIAGPGVPPALATGLTADTEGRGASADPDARSRDDEAAGREAADRAAAGGPARRGPRRAAPAELAEKPGATPAVPAAAAARAAGAPEVPAATPAAPALGAVAAQRVADVLAAQERGGARQVSHLTLRLENAAGGEDRIRVDLRSGGPGPATVGARIDVADLGAADRLAARVGELRDALARHGLASDAVQVGGGAPAARPAEAVPPAAAVSSAAAASAGGESGNASGGGSSSQQQPGRDPSRDGAREGGFRDAAGRDPQHRGGDARQQGRRPHDGWLYDELAAPRRAR